MPRIARVAPGGIVQHVINRGNGRREIFKKPLDYRAFLKLMGEAKEKVPMRVLGFCLMPNHWHLVLWPRRDGELSAFMAWLSNAHVRRYHQHHQSYGEGHIYQGRFKNFPVQSDEHLRTVLRYVESNALRGGLVRRAERWAYGSVAEDVVEEAKGLVDEWPVERPGKWVEIVNERLPERELERLRRSTNRGTPFGSDRWVKLTAGRLGLEKTMRERGRPRKEKKEG